MLEAQKQRATVDLLPIQMRRCCSDVKLFHHDFKRHLVLLDISSFESTLIHSICAADALYHSIRDQSSCMDHQKKIHLKNWHNLFRYSRASDANSHFRDSYRVLASGWRDNERTGNLAA